MFVLKLTLEQLLSVIANVVDVDLPGRWLVENRSNRVLDADYAERMANTLKKYTRITACQESKLN